jgi:ATP-dependent Zn protease
MDGSQQQVSFARKIVLLTEHDNYKLVITNYYSNQSVQVDLVSELRTLKNESKTESNNSSFFDSSLFIYILIIIIIIFTLLILILGYEVHENKKVQRENINITHKTKSRKQKGEKIKVTDKKSSKKGKPSKLRKTKRKETKTISA